MPQQPPLGSPFPELHKIAMEESMEHKDDIPLAIKHTRKRGEKLTDWPAYIDGLLNKSIRLMVNTIRHHIDIKIRKAAGMYGGPAQVTISAATSGAAATIYQYMILGRTLGGIFGHELGGIAKSEAERADGHMFNSKLCATLQPLVPQDKLVKDAVSQKKLQAIFKKLMP